VVGGFAAAFGAAAFRGFDVIVTFFGAGAAAGLTDSGDLLTFDSVFLLGLPEAGVMLAVTVGVGRSDEISMRSSFCQWRQ
jgi:hypothetical protein